MSETIYSHIHRLVANDETEHAIRDLEVSLRNKDNDLHQEVIILARKYRSVQKQLRSGTINREDASLEMTQVNHGMLQIAEEASEQYPLRISNALHPSYIIRKPWYKRYSFALLMGIYALMAGICFTLLSIPQKRVLGELDIYSSRMSFQIMGNGNFMLNQAIEETQIQQFQEIILPSRKAQIDRDFDGQIDAEYTSESGLSISPKIVGSMVSFDDVGLKELFFSDGARFIFTLAPDNEGTLLLDLIDPDTCFGSLEFRDSSAFFSLNEVTVDGWDGENYVQYGEGYVFDYGRPIRFVGQNKSIRLEFFNGEALHFEKEEGLIDSLKFVDSYEGRPKSSVLSANVRMLTDENQVFDSLHIDKGEALAIALAEPLRMEMLVITPEHIHLKAQGYFKRLAWGNDLEHLKNQNPSLLRWWWHNHRYKFIFILLVLGASTLILSRRLVKGW